MKRSWKKINFFEFMYYHKMSFLYTQNEEDWKLHKYICDKIDNKEINKKNFRNYLDLEYIKEKMKNER